MTSPERPAHAPAPDTPSGFEFPCDGRSPDLRVLAYRSFPVGDPLPTSGSSGSLTAYSCGGSRGIGGDLRTAFPFHPEPTDCVPQEPSPPRLAPVRVSRQLHMRPLKAEMGLRVRSEGRGLILGSGPINSTTLVLLFSALTRRRPAGIVVLFQRDVTQIRGENSKIQRTCEALHSSGFARLALTPPVPARSNPLLLCSSHAGAAGLMGPDPRRCGSDVLPSAWQIRQRGS